MSTQAATEPLRRIPLCIPVGRGHCIDLAAWTGTLALSQQRGLGEHPTADCPGTISLTSHTPAGKVTPRSLWATSHTARTVTVIREPLASLRPRRPNRLTGSTASGNDCGRHVPVVTIGAVHSIYALWIIQIV